MARRKTVKTRRSGMDPETAKALAKHRLTARDELHAKRMAEQEVRLKARGPAPNRANQFLRAHHMYKRRHPGAQTLSATEMQEMGLV